MSSQRITSDIERKLRARGLQLPDAPLPAANYVPTQIAGDMLFVSGQLPVEPDGLAFSGRVDDQLAMGDAVAAAQLCALNILAQTQRALGDLSRIGQIVKLTGFVWSSPQFTGQPAIINGASDLYVDLLGERGHHARSAVGVAALPLGAPVEIEAMIAIAR